MGGVILRRSEPGELRFTASADHASVTSYEVRVRALGSDTVIATQDVGKPALSRQNKATVNLSDLFATLDPGNYAVTVATIAPGGTTDSGVSNEFSLPLA